jgi:hypothetical protein
VQFWEEFDGDALRLLAGEIALPARLLTCRPEDRCAGTAHWLEFEVPPDARATLADAKSAAYLTADYRTYQHQSQPLGPALRQSLVDDLQLSDRDRG